MHQNLANSIRFLSMDAVEKAKSGHPGMPMGMADIAVVLWREFLHHNPTNPKWWNRDRFVLSNGHGSMLLYSLLHLTGYDLSIDDLKAFRQFDSKTPGHPEYGYAPGVETTTGPLGQGLANAVGMALAEKILAAQFNKKDFSIIDHHTYVFLGDGCLMEGVSHEAAALAGTWGLNKLVAFWDDNGISIDGEVEGWFTDDTPKRFEAYGWHVIKDVDGHDPDAVRQALLTAHFEKQRPVLICCKTKIGYGSPNKVGKETCHGAPLGAEEIEKTREALGWTHPPFEIPQDVYAAFDAKTQGQERELTWTHLFADYQKAYPELAAELTRRINGTLPDLYGIMSERLNFLNEQKPTIATRKASQDALSILVPYLPELLGGSADLTGSNLTFTPSSKGIAHKDFSGNYLYYGVREFGMSAIANGLALHQGFIPYVSTFLVFTDYARNAIRMSAIMKQRVIYVMTHDSIGLGEDGPTHQPIEHVNSLRLIPNLHVWRPADAVETLIAWQLALEEKEGPSLLALSRQNLETFPRIDAQMEQVKRGGYVLHYTAEKPQLNLIATGSEVQLAMKASHLLQEQGVMSKVISVPCLEKFMSQDAVYQHEVMGDVPSLVIEAGTTGLWYKLIKGNGAILGIDTFGESAKADDLFKHFGFTPEHVAEMAKNLIEHAA